MNELLFIVDNTPIVYVFPSAYLIFKLGEAVEANNPSLRFWQHATGSLVFITLVLRRLAWETPVDAVGVADVLFRSGCFAFISAGLAGVIGYAVLAVVIARRHVGSAIGSLKRHWSKWRQRVALSRKEAVRPLTREQLIQQRRVEEDAIRAEEKETTRKTQLAAEARRRRSLLLQAKIALETTLDESMRSKMSNWLNEFASDSLSIDEVQEHLGLMHETMQRFKSQRRRFASVAEILAHYKNERQHLEEMELPPAERDQLWAILSMQQQIAIQEFNQE